MKYLIHLSFKGTNYSGWQTQLSVNSVQQTIESALSQIFGKKTMVHGCGRTDAGVHASQYFCHFKTTEKISRDFIFILNKNLPDDISIFNYLQVDDAFNAQLSALEREYKYFIHTKKNAFLSDLSTLILEPMDLKHMEKAIELVPEYMDFEAFTLKPDKQTHTVSRVKSLSLELNPGQNQLCFTIRADAYIRGMVRLLVGNIVEIGKGNLSIYDFEKALSSGKPVKFSKLAFPQGLYLSGVSYPNHKFPCLGTMPF